jgi:hypothetical protein
MVSALVRLVMVASAVLATACSLAVDPDQVQCEVAADCAAIGEADRRCIDNLCTGSFKTDCGEIPWAEEVNSEKVDVSIGGFTKDTAAVDGIVITACGNSTCTPPADVSEATGLDGRTSVTVHQGFRGRFEFPTPDAAVRASYILHMHPWPDPLEPDTLLANAVIIPLSEISDIASQLPVAAHQPELGHLFFAIRDCEGEILEKVTVQLQDAAANVQVVYLGTNLNPDLSLSETGTGAQGGGVMYNIPTGLGTIYAYYDGKKIFQQTLVFKAETITTTQIVPSIY